MAFTTLVLRHRSRVIGAAPRRVVLAAASVALAYAMNISVSQPAMATCTPASSGLGSPPGTYSDPATGNITCDNAPDIVNVVPGAGVGTITTSGGDDTVTITGGTTGATNLGDANDKYTISGAAVRSGTLTGGVGNDLLVIKAGTFTGNIDLGNTTASAADTDRLFTFGGSFTGTELQTGAGTDPFLILMDGSMFGGSLEIRRGSTRPTIVFDGMTLVNEEGIELQTGNAGQAASISPTIYFRSGYFQADELELVNTGGANANPAPSNVTVIFDPINSKDPAFFMNLVDNAANGGASTLSTANLTADLFTAPANPNANHQIFCGWRRSSSATATTH